MRQFQDNAGAGVVFFSLNLFLVGFTLQRLALFELFFFGLGVWVFLWGFEFRRVASHATLEPSLAART